MKGMVVMKKNMQSSERRKLLTENYQKYNLDIVFDTHFKNYDIHSHDYYEIELITSGKGINIINGNSFEIQKGSFYFLTPSDFHELIIIEPLTLYNLSFSDIHIPNKIVNLLLESNLKKFFSIDDNTYKFIKTYCEKIYTELQIKSQYNFEIIKNLLECIFIEIIRLQKNTEKTEYKNSNIQNAILYIHSHFRENPSLTTVAKYININKNYFCEIFHKTTGKSYTAYLRDLKLDYAKSLAQHTTLQISEICFTCGYSSFSHFLREFKSKFKLSPMQIRKINQNKHN